MNAGQETRPENRTDRNRRNLVIALTLIVGSLATEIAGSLLSGSLALLADAGDMVTNITAISLALLSLWLSGRPASAERTFGLRRTEVLAALANAITLWTIAAWIFLEAYERFQEAPEVEGGIMLVAGVIVLLFNAAAAATLYRSAQQNITVEGAFRHILADALGSVGVVVSGILIVTLGWTLADPIASIAIAALIILSSLPMWGKVLHVLMEGVPENVDVYRLCSDLEEEEGVTVVHDIHVWTISSGYNAITAHVLVDPSYRDDPYALLRRLTDIARSYDGIEHVTIQLEQSAEGCTEDHHVNHLMARARPRPRRRRLLPF